MIRLCVWLLAFQVVGCGGIARNLKRGDVPKPGEVVFVGRARFTPDVTPDLYVVDLSNTIHKINLHFARHKKRISSPLETDFEFLAAVEKDKSFAFVLPRQRLYFFRMQLAVKLWSAEMGSPGMRHGAYRVIRCEPPRPIEIDPKDSAVVYLGDLTCSHAYDESRPRKAVMEIERLNGSLTTRNEWKRDSAALGALEASPMIVELGAS